MKANEDDRGRNKNWWIHQLLCIWLCYCYCLVTKSCPAFLQLHELQPTRVLSPWKFPGKNIGVRCHFLLQVIFPIQGSNLHFLHWQADSLQLTHLGSPHNKNRQYLLNIPKHLPDNSRTLYAEQASVSPPLLPLLCHHSQLGD